MNQAILNKTRNDKFLMVLDIPNYLKRTYDKILNENVELNLTVDWPGLQSR